MLLNITNIINKFTISKPKEYQKKMSLLSQAMTLRNHKKYSDILNKDISCGVVGNAPTLFSR